MALLKKNKFIFVRSKKTGRIDIRHADDFSGRYTSASNQQHELHYIGRGCTRVCRCANPNRHPETFVSLPPDLSRFSISLALYMERRNIESTTITQFGIYEKKRKDMWREYGVDIDDFHYASKDKNIVCRCSLPFKHDYGIPQNPNIIERCTRFFVQHKGEKLCTKKEWRGMNSLPPAYSSTTLHLSSHESRYEPFQYDSPSTYNLLRKRAAQKDCPSVAPILDVRDTAGDYSVTDMHYLRSGSHGEPDIPEEIWRNSRPFAWRLSHHGTESSATTPLGTAFTPISPQTRTMRNSPIVTATPQS
ncbi:hypothetical protein BKA66DRAFT_564785 [Pyrenochaeta sp. MPI-SDFR-AT-0127]|nr:hypothetical protein BKA66DRAFT_564785 [Pyrenochaeta sp. MPI-SDFR-AT-0127]